MSRTIMTGGRIAMAQENGGNREPQRPIRLAVIGGRRGAAFRRAFEVLSDKIRLAAICDRNERVLQSWRETDTDVKRYADYEGVLNDPDIDAVFLATPVSQHGRQAIAALNAGKHVMSEVPAAFTLDECWELVETVERTGLVYMLAENYCYMRDNMLVGSMAGQGLFGEITFAEGGYMHDARNLTHDAEGNLTWRGQLRHSFNGMHYPTHMLGPIAQWLGINRDGGDEFDYMSTYVSKEAAAHLYYKETFGERHEGADRAFWSQGDSAVTLIRTKKGVLIQLRLDTKSPRPHNMTHYGLQGARGAFVSARHKEEQGLVWLEGHSRGSTLHEAKDEAKWEPLDAYADRYEHELWRRWSGDALKAGHGGGDFFILEEFSSAILEKRRPAIDVYDAVTWSCVAPLSAISVETGGKPLPFPNFRAKRDSESRT
ncbi:Gfo/Idh/MocA family protein [Paenibacillus hemerocallicola]|nr:Gfo/Idh/MocA family oxidoreductase [Paenibacillus hemerocallicola]